MEHNRQDFFFQKSPSFFEGFSEKNVKGNSIYFFYLKNLSCFFEPPHLLIILNHTILQNAVVYPNNSSLDYTSKLSCYLILLPKLFGVSLLFLVQNCQSDLGSSLIQLFQMALMVMLGTLV